MGGNFCQILELGGGTTIKGRRVFITYFQKTCPNLLTVWSYLGVTPPHPPVAMPLSPPSMK